MKLSETNAAEWRKANDKAVEQFLSHQQNSPVFQNILSLVQSFPYQSMLPEVEVTLADNLLISYWLTRDTLEENIKNLVTNTLIRLVRYLQPSVFLDEDSEIATVMEKLLESKLYQHLSFQSLVAVLEIVSLIILSFHVSNDEVVKSYLRWTKLMKISLSEISPTIRAGVRVE